MWLVEPFDVDTKLEMVTSQQVCPTPPSVCCQTHTFTIVLHLFCSARGGEGKWFHTEHSLCHATLQKHGCGMGLGCARRVLYVYVHTGEHPSRDREWAAGGGVSWWLTLGCSRNKALCPVDQLVDVHW